MGHSQWDDRVDTVVEDPGAATPDSFATQFPMEPCCRQQF